MSKLLCCENCGTMFDPQKGNCPICGGKAEQPSTPEAPAAEPVMEEILAGLEFPEPDAGATSDPPAAPAPETPEAPADADPEPTPEEPAPETPAPAPAPRPVKRPQNAPRGGSGSPERQRPRPSPSSSGPADPERPPRRKKTKKKGTITTRDKVVCLILAALVIFFALFILYRFLRPHMGNTGETTPSTENTAPSTQPDLRCTSVLVEKTVTLTEIGQSQKLEITVSPADTTDTLNFVSDAPQVATVSADGVVTAVAAGQANITVTCGNVMAVCTIKCDFAPDETTAPTEPSTPTTPPETTEPTIALPSELEMNKTDISFFSKGEGAYLNVGDWTSVVTWESSDTSVAKVDDDGYVTAVGGGTCTIYARLENLEATCIVRCRFEAAPDPDEDDGDNGGGEDDGATISHTDVSLDEGETFTLRLKDKDGNTLEVQWQVEDDDICSVDGNRVKGLSKGTTTVYCTYKGTRYECIVRVR